jgi:hypothetical protein
MGALAPCPLDRMGTVPAPQDPRGDVIATRNEPRSSRLRVVPPAEARHAITEDAAPRLRGPHGKKN